MFFTREDILKIQQALLQLGVKDSELPNAEPVTYNDTLSIVQDGKNKQIGVKEFFNQISLWKREDFINITDKYDEHYISLTEAINLVPILQRKNGLVITFQDIEGNWEIYQFRGNITEFFNIEKWFDLYDYRNYIVQSIVPDEEDLTVSIPDENGNSLVHLKDRVYDPTNFSGKGYKILRRNIKPVSIAVTKIRVESVPSTDGTLSFTVNGKETQVAVSAIIDNTTALVSQKVAAALQNSMTEYEISKDASLITLTRKFGGIVTPSAFSTSTTGVVCTIIDSIKEEYRNILTQDMINQSNTIYEIRYDFNLNGKTINFPEGTKLSFNGGSFDNGTLTSGTTYALQILKSSTNIFKKDLILNSNIFFDNTIYSNIFEFGKYFLPNIEHFRKVFLTENKYNFVTNLDYWEFYYGHARNNNDLHKSLEIIGIPETLTIIDCSSQLCSPFTVDSEGFNFILRNVIFIDNKENIIKTKSRNRLIFVFMNGNNCSFLFDNVILDDTGSGLIGNNMRTIKKVELINCKFKCYEFLFEFTNKCFNAEFIARNCEFDTSSCRWVSIISWPGIIDTKYKFDNCLIKGSINKALLEITNSKYATYNNCTFEDQNIEFAAYDISKTGLSEFNKCVFKTINTSINLTNSNAIYNDCLFDLKNHVNLSTNKADLVFKFNYCRFINMSTDKEILYFTGLVNGEGYKDVVIINNCEFYNVSKIDNHKTKEINCKWLGKASRPISDIEDSEFLDYDNARIIHNKLSVGKYYLIAKGIQSLNKVFRFRILDRTNIYTEIVLITDDNYTESIYNKTIFVDPNNSLTIHLCWDGYYKNDINLYLETSSTIKNVTIENVSSNGIKLMPYLVEVDNIDNYEKKVSYIVKDTGLLISATKK